MRARTVSEGIMPKKTIINPSVQVGDIILIMSFDLIYHTSASMRYVGQELKVLSIDETRDATIYLFAKANNGKYIDVYCDVDTFIKIS
jgi:hypothetical protein